jgi:hypothetical protein
MALAAQRSRPRRWLTGPVALVLVGATLLIPATSAASEPTDMVLTWNAHAVAAISNAPTATPPGLGQPPPVSPIHLAMVQGAVYDAVNAIDGTRRPYLSGLSAPAGASRAAAAATAAHHVLVGLAPVTDPPHPMVTSVNALYTASLGTIPDATPEEATAKADGVAVGAAAAAAMLLERTGDGRFGSLTFTPGTGVGEWRLVTATNNNVFGWAARVKPFTMRSTGQFRTEGPLPIGSAEYAAEFNEVKALGAKVNSSRTVDQAALALFVTGNPVPYMNRAFREIAAARGLSTSQQARLFVSTSMASADALIGCWDDKMHWNFWRPQTAIRLAADDGNPLTEPDATWESNFPTPGYPDHPSGYNCYAAAMMHSAKAFFGTDNIAFTLTSPAAGSVPRQYTRFTDVIDDTINGRIYTGFHFRTPDVQGAWLGKRAANWTASHFFKPAP